MNKVHTDYFLFFVSCFIFLNRSFCNFYSLAQSKFYGLGYRLSPVSSDNGEASCFSSFFCLFNFYKINVQKRMILSCMTCIKSYGRHVLVLFWPSRISRGRGYSYEIDCTGPGECHSTRSLNRTGYANNLFSGLSGKGVHYF